MDKLAQYQEIITKILTEYAQLPYAHGELQRELVIDADKTHFLLLTLGWENKRRVHGCLVHIDIIDSKIWIQRDGIEEGITKELLAAGIPKDSIVLGFHPAHVRKHTEFAVN